MRFSDEVLFGTFKVGWLGDEPLTFDRVEFSGCSMRGDVTDPTALTVSNVQIRDCVVRGGLVSGVHLRGVLVDGLRTANLPGLSGNVYEHVTLRGRVQQLILNDAPLFLGPGEFNAEKRTFTAEAYQSIDWALDISELEARDVSIRGVPARLIRHNPEVHAVVSHAAAIAGAWRDLDLGRSPVKISLSQLAMSNWEDTVLIPAAWGKYAEPDKIAIERLREAGVAS